MERTFRSAANLLGSARLWRAGLRISAETNFENAPHDLEPVEV
jgi:hypothetical protein